MAMSPTAHHPYKSTTAFQLTPLLVGDTLNAVDLATGELRWSMPIGDVPLLGTWGLPNLGVPFVTKTGLVFLAAAFDSNFRACDIETGEVPLRSERRGIGQGLPPV